MTHWSVLRISVAAMAIAFGSGAAADELSNDKIRGIPFAEYPNTLNRTKTVSPEYPLGSDQCRTGYAIVQYTVTYDGKTTDIQIVESEPATLFDKRTKKAVKKWRFEKPMIDGEHINVVGVRNELTFDNPSCTTNFPRIP